MSISNESLPIIAGIIANTARSMTTVMQYIYTVSDSDFYNINIKDVFRIALMDVTETSRLENLGIRIKTPENEAMFETAEFGRVQHLIMYSLAVRLPFIARQKAEKSFAVIFIGLVQTLCLHIYAEVR